MIRNYYNFATNSYATNSYLVDYAPDFLQEVAEATDDAALADVAQRSAAMVVNAATPAGLLHQVVQPELKTLTPTGQAIFSPNNVEQLANAASVAERSAAMCPTVAANVLSFVEQRWPTLHSFYNANTGEPIGAAGVDVATLASLVRLSVRLDNRTMRERLLNRLTERGSAFADDPVSPRAYVAGEALLALQAVLDDDARP